MAELNGTRVAVIATNGVEESELTEPMEALREAGAICELLSVKTGEIQSFKHSSPSTMYPVDRALDQVDPSSYDALLLPGGALNADKLRMEPSVQSCIKSMNSAGKPMAVICHAPWELVSAGIVAGRTMTSYYTIQDDIRNAGADWVDREVVVDGNLVTSRKPDDIPAFNREMIKLFSAVPAGSRS